MRIITDAIQQQGETLEEPSDCRNCAHAFGRVPCQGRNFRKRPERCPRGGSRWLPLGYMFRPLSDAERQRIIDEELGE